MENFDKEIGYLIDAVDHFRVLATFDGSLGLTSGSTVLCAGRVAKVSYYENWGLWIDTKTLALGDDDKNIISKGFTYILD